MGKKLGNKGKVLLAEVSGLKIYADSVYVVTGKFDEGAPTGFQDYGISKAPFPANKSIGQCSWDKYLRVYDTGFFESSLCFKGMSSESVEEEVNRRIEYIKKPYEDSTGNDLDQKNFDFWDTFTVAVYEGRMFYTKDISDLFDLYVALQSKILTPKDEDGNPDFQNSMYCIEDKTTAVDVRKQRQLDKTDIMYNFMSSLNKGEDEKQNMIDLLIYLGVIHTSQMDDSMIRYIFTDWIESKSTNIDMFKEAYNRFIGVDKEPSPNNKDVVKYHRILRELSYTEDVTVSSAGISVGNTILGADFITSSYNLVNDKELIEVKAGILEKYNNFKDNQRKVKS